MIGTVLGNRYELLEIIGEGGMAVVYKAKCNLLMRFVAVKILKKEFSKDKEFVNKFISEALAVASLSQNNIVNIYDVGSQDDINYIVMEYVDGKTLKELITESGRIEYSKAINISIQIARALDCAHKNNIIHRDIKPHNILVTNDGIIKVTDFGIARASNSTTIENTNKILGSAHYFSPEQAKGTMIDARTDIYSLGVVMYEMIVGKVPYDAESPVSIALKHIQEPVIPPIELNHYIPESLNALILKAMEKDPINRYQKIKDMLFDLEKIQENPEYEIDTASLEDDNTTIMEPITEDALKKTRLTKKTKIIIISAISFVLVLVLATAVIMMNRSNAANIDVKVPKIIGLDQAAAKKIVEASNLKFTVAAKEVSDKPIGTVTKVSPDEGTPVKVNSEVRVFVSSGTTSQKVLDYKDMDVEQAKSMIKDGGLQLGTITNKNDKAAAGTVIGQSPDPDTPITADTKINLIVSKGPEVVYATVPDLKGMLINDAGQILTNLKLKLGNQIRIPTIHKDQDGKVLTQSIAANSPNVKQGTSIDVSYSYYGIPDIQTYKGRTLQEYKNYIESMDITFVNGDNLPLSTIIDTTFTTAPTGSGQNVVTVTVNGG